MASDGAKEQVTEDDKIDCVGGRIVLLEELVLILST